MIVASIPSALMKSLKLRIENQRKIFYNDCRQKVYIQRDFEPQLSKKKAGAIAPVGPKVKPSRGGAVFTDSPSIFRKWVTR